jgi:hypothetical protein
MDHSGAIKMGTNYYWKEGPDCPTCRRSFTGKHIGKSSHGWTFALHVYPDQGIDDIEDWEKLWQKAGSMIIDEYGEKLGADEMRQIITSRAREERWHARPYGHISWENFHLENQSLPGPYGLIRSQLNYRCIKHGVGTWDCHVGDFS